MRTHALLGAVLGMFVLAGCNDKKEAPSAAPAASAKTTAAEVPLKDATGKVTLAGFKAAWQSVYFAPSAAAEPADKKKAAFLAKVGPAAKTEGDTLVYFAVDAGACHKIELGKDGTMGTEKVANASCGL